MFNEVPPEALWPVGERVGNDGASALGKRPRPALPSSPAIIREAGDGAGAQQAAVVAATGGGEVVELIFIFSDGVSELPVRMKRNAPFSLVFMAIENHLNLGTNHFRCMYGGSRIQGDMTPATLQLENGDTLRVIVEQVGC